MKKQSKTWLCPICGFVDMPYGKNTCNSPRTCGNEPHMTGLFYVDELGNLKRLKTDSDSLGISKISNED
jgi:hypothetical protein